MASLSRIIASDLDIMLDRVTIAVNDLCCVCEDCLDIRLMGFVEP